MNRRALWRSWWFMASLYHRHMCAWSHVSKCFILTVCPNAAIAQCKGVACLQLKMFPEIAFCLSRISKTFAIIYVRTTADIFHRTVWSRLFTMLARDHSSSHLQLFTSAVYLCCLPLLFTSAVYLNWLYVLSTIQAITHYRCDSQECSSISTLTCLLRMKNTTKDTPMQSSKSHVLYDVLLCESHDLFMIICTVHTYISLWCVPWMLAVLT